MLVKVGVFASSFSPLRYRTFTRENCLKKSKFVFQKSLFKTPFKPERISSCTPNTGEMKVSTSTVAALFSKMALTGQRIAMVDMVLLVFFQHVHIYCRVGWSQSFPLKIFFSCSLGGGGRYFSAACSTTCETSLLKTPF